jgi:uncharacterized protein DUF4878
MLALLLEPRPRLAPAWTPPLRRLEFDPAAFAPGDLVFRRGRSLVSQAVLAAEGGGEYSHVGVVAVSAGRVWVLHALPPDEGEKGGVIAEPLEVFLAPQKASAGALYRPVDRRAAPHCRRRRLEARPRSRAVRRRLRFDDHRQAVLHRARLAELPVRGRRPGGGYCRAARKVPAARPSPAEPAVEVRSNVPTGDCKSMKRQSLSFYAVLVLAVLPLACVGHSPSATVKAFYKAVSEGHTDEAIDLLSARTINTVGRDKLRAGIQNSAQKMLDKGGVKSMDVTEEKVAGDVAQVTIILKYGNGEQEIENVKLVKEEKGWRLQPNK